jgi:hypothetical protein
MQSPIYLASAIASCCAMYLIWSFGIRKLLLDRLRENLFDLRFQLFRLAMQKEIEFDGDAYRNLETLFNGLLRFGHRISLLTYVLSKIEVERASKEKDFVSFSSQMSLRISRLEPDTQKKIHGILNQLHHELMRYMAQSSLFFMSTYLVFTVLDAIGLAHLTERKKEVGRVIEQEAYFAESRRSMRLAVA